MFFLKKSVALIVVLTLMTVITLVLTTLGIINYTSEQTQLRTKLRLELAVNADQISTGLALPVWNIDRGQIDKVIESVMKNHDVYGILVNAAGKNHIRVRDTLWEVKEVQKEFPSTGLLSEERDITFSHESIGHVKLFATTRFVEEELRSVLFSTISTILLIDLILTFSLYLLIWRNVLKPLKEVEEYAVAVSSEGAQNVSIRGTRFPGELAGLRTSIEKMVTLLRSRYAELNEEVNRRRESEERYRTLAETATDAIVTIDQNSKILFTNAAIEKVFGYGVEELLGQQLTVLMPEYLRRIHETSLKRYIGTGKQHVAWDAVELTGLHKSGKELPLEVSFGEFKKNGVHFFTGIIRDVTERKRAEQALRESEAHYRALSENTPDIIAAFDRECRYLFVNSSISKVSAIKPEEFVGKTLREVGFTNEQAEVREKVIRTVFATRIPSETEFEFIGQAGRAVYDWRVYPVLDSAGAVLSAFSISRDITERKRAEGELRQSEEKFAKAFRASPDSVTLSNLHTGTLLEVNNGFERMFGYARSEAVGKSTLELNLYTNLADRASMIDILNRDGRVRDLELIGRTKSGESRTCLLSVEAIEIGGTPSLITIVRDITERKQSERELQESYKQLQALAAHLETIREEERKRIAREIHDELGQVLTVVKMDLTLLGRTAKDEPIENIRARLDTDIKNDLELIDRSIQSIRRIASELRPEVLDELGFKSAIEWQANEFQTRTGIPCICRATPANIHVPAEASIALFRIVQEALTNIARHAEAKHVEIDIEQSANDLTVSVCDDGKGYSAQQQSAQKTLGLLGMRERAILLGGEFIIQGTPGKGTTVSVHVPR